MLPHRLESTQMSAVASIDILIYLYTIVTIRTANTKFDVISRRIVHESCAHPATGMMLGLPQWLSEHGEIKEDASLAVQHGPGLDPSESPWK